MSGYGASGRVDVNIVLHHVPVHVVESGHRKDHVVALESQKIVKVGHLMKFRRLFAQVRCGKYNLYGDMRRFQRMQSSRLVLTSADYSVVLEYWNIQIVKAKIPLIRRLVRPNSLHV